MERMGSLMVEKGILAQPDPPTQNIGQNGNHQGRRRSERLERAREHLDFWGRRGRSQPGRYWRSGLIRSGLDVREERLEDAFNDFGYSDEEDEEEEWGDILPRNINFEDFINDEII